MTRTDQRLAATAMLAALAALPTDARAAPIEMDTIESIETEQGEIIVTGNRFGGRTATDSPTPVDAITRDQLQQSGRVDLIQQLKVEVPSFNTPRPLGSGVGDYLQPPSLRGLGPGEVLVLVNGKRRHTSSDLNASNGVGRGDVSVDFNAIPSFALERAEVLRDGASAQYGSDAISGVINLMLDRSVGTRAQMTGGITTAGDGAYGEASISSGVRVGADGAFRLTASLQRGEGTNRSQPDMRQQYFGTNAAGRPVAVSGNYGSGTGLTPANGALDPREATIDRNVFRFGDQPSLNRQVFANFVAPASESVEVYAFGGYSRLDGDIEYFFRRAGQNETLRAFYPDGYRPVLDSQLENFLDCDGASRHRPRRVRLGRVERLRRQHAGPPLRQQRQRDARRGLAPALLPAGLRLLPVDQQSRPHPRHSNRRWSAG